MGKGKGLENEMLFIAGSSVKAHCTHLYADFLHLWRKLVTNRYWSQILLVTATNIKIGSKPRPVPLNYIQLSSQPSVKLLILRTVFLESLWFVKHC